MTADLITASVHVQAPPNRVFEHFTSSAAMTRWMGQWAELVPVVGGRFAVDIEGVPVRGSYLELDPPRRLVISWGHAGSTRLPPGASPVAIPRTPEADGTR
ncbi:MAG: SRPBCC family protein, partial [Solirubrobacteraceae bacterium]